MRETHSVHPAPKMKYYYVFNHQNKADRMIEALNINGHTISPSQTNYRHVNFILTDYAAWGRLRQLRRIAGDGVKRFFEYPHAARPNLISDLTEVWEGITAQFVTAPGHVKIMQKFGYPKPLYVIGWMLCEQKKFKPREQARKVLFAPIHPRCADIDKQVNADTFKILFKLAKKDKIDLTVRHINDLEDAGLEQITHPNVHYVPGSMDNSYDQLDNADVVVGHQTVAYIAVARGVPTLMMGERILPTHYLKVGHPTIFVKNWDKYVDDLAYPLDILEAKNPMHMLEKAVKCDDKIADWRARMIGEPFNASYFVRTIESYL